MLILLAIAERKVKETHDSYFDWNPCCATRMMTAEAKKQVLHEPDDASSIAAVMSPALKTNVAPQ